MHGETNIYIYIYKEYKYFQNDYIGGVKTKNKKTLRFTGRRIKAAHFLIPMVDYTPPPHSY
jgi:hypothetical protein